MNQNRSISIPETPPILDKLGDLAIGQASNVLLILIIIIIYEVKNYLQAYINSNIIYKHYVLSVDKIDQQLHRLMGEIKCQRICVAQFHNGEKLLNKFHHLKWSLTHQIVEPGIQKTPYYVSRPISILNEELALLKHAPRGLIHIAANSPIYKRCQMYLEPYGIKHLYLSMLRNAHGVPVGVVGIHFTHDISLTQVEEISGIIYKYIKSMEEVIR